MPGHLHVYQLDDGRLLVGRPKGVLYGELATKFAEFVELKEALTGDGIQPLL